MKETIEQTGIPAKPTRVVHFNNQGFAMREHPDPEVGTVYQVTENSDPLHFNFSGMKVLVIGVYPHYMHGGQDFIGIAQESVEDHAKRHLQYAIASFVERSIPIPKSCTLDYFIKFVHDECINETGDIIVEFDSFYLESVKSE